MPSASATALVHAAQAAQRCGDVAQAGRLLHEALGTDPRHFGALCGLALLSLAAGRPSRGLELVDRALHQRPRSAEALHLRACLLQAAGQIDAAIAGFRAALAIQPAFVDALVNLGGLLSERRQHREAADLFQAALRARPGFAAAHNNLGASLLAMGQAEAALAQFDAAIAARAEFADAHGNRGSALSALGRLGDARAAFETAIRLAPREGKFYLDLARCGRFPADDPHLPAMQALAAAPAGLSPASRIALEFALGKALGDLGQATAAFPHWAQGNTLKRASIAYDERATLGAMATLPAAFSGSRLLARAAGGAASAVPVFVVGMPRSGTTLVEQILASHPSVFGAGERPDLHLLAVQESGAATPAALFEALGGLPEAALTRLGQRYVAGLAAAAPQAGRIVDKMPGNFLYAGLIALALPRARILHVRRDALDTCFSCFTTLFSGQQNFTYEQGELGRYYRAYERLMEHWRQSLPPGLMLEIRYEELVADLPGVARQMLSHCGLDWDERCLDFHTTARAVQTASRAQVRQPLYQGSVGRAASYRPMLQELVLALEGPDGDGRA
jgi:tetratricopeptide (TPR) repeat protein